MLTLAGLTVSALPAPVTAHHTGPLTQSVVGLRQGATGDDVRALQNALMAAGVSVPGGADGIFGPKTKSSVTAFQSRRGLATSGEVDDATAQALGLSGGGSSSTATSSSAVLAIGARGDAVKELQRALMATGVFVAGGADGIFGPATKTAVTNFQRWNDLPVSGDVDSATSARLKLGGASSSGSSGGGSQSSSSSSSFSGMKLGARGDNVKVLQQALINAGISVRGGADGWFGPATQAALTTYQQANGLTANGVVDDAARGQVVADTGRCRFDVRARSGTIGQRPIRRAHGR